jgi:hypothetical protein
MAFSGKSTNEAFAVSQVAEDVAAMVAALSPKEVPLLDFLGDADVFATSTKHEYWQDYMLPNYIISSGVINSATAATGIQINGQGLALTEGTILENETSAELMQVTSVVGANSVLVNRNYGGGGIGSLVAGGQLYVRAMAGVEGQDHNGSGVRRLGNRLANTVGYFNLPFAASKTQMAINELGNDSFDSAVAKGLIDVLHQLEKEVIRGVLNSTNSLGSATLTRTMQGVRQFVTTVNSNGISGTAASFSANPHLYIGNAFDSMFQAGASPNDTWLILAGRTLFRDISNMNDTKIEDTSSVEQFKRVIRRYTGPFGSAEVQVSRVLSATELILIPRERIKVVPLQGRSFEYEQLGKTGDNVKGEITGEYTVEVHHESAMARFRTAA